MKNLTKTQAEKELGKSLNFFLPFLQNGNHLFLLKNDLGCILYAVHTSDGMAETVESSLTDFNEVEKFSELFKNETGLTLKELRKDPVLLEEFAAKIV